MERVDMSRRRVGVMLVLLLMGEFALVQPSPAPRPVRLSAVTNKNFAHSDLNSLPADQLLSLDVEQSHASGGLTSVPEFKDNSDDKENTDEETGKERSLLSEKLLLEMVLDLEGDGITSEAEEELTDSLSDAVVNDVQEGDLFTVIDKGLKQRQEKVTPRVLTETSQLMEDLAAFEELVASSEEWTDSVQGLCGEQVVTSVQRVVLNLGESGGVFKTLTTVALLQLHHCPSAALLLTTHLVNILDNAQTSNTTLPSRGTGNKHEEKDRCQDSVECRQRYISTVRQILSRYPSLVALYDAAATAVFATSDNVALTEALLKNVLGDLHISTPHIHIHKHSQSPLYGHTRSKRDSCEDKGEKKAQEIISWIPFIGTLYNLISSAVYAGKGCTKVAEERARDGALDLVMDAATVLTGGAAAGIATGAKTLVKVGVKAGLKAGLKAGAKTGAKAFKKLGKKMLKETVKGYKNPLKGAAKEIKDTLGAVVKGVKAVPKAVKAVPKAVKAVPKVIKSVPKATKDAVRGLGKTLKQMKEAGKQAGKKVDDVYVPKTPDSPSVGSKADRNMDSAVEESSHIICKRSPKFGNKGPCNAPRQGNAPRSGAPARNRPKSDIPNYAELKKELLERASKEYQEKLLKRFDDIWKTHKPKRLNSAPGGGDYVTDPASRSFYELDLTGTQMQTKDLLEALQQHRQYRPTSQVGLQVKMEIGGKPVQFISVPSEWTKGLAKNSMGQVGIFTKSGNRIKAMTYKEIWTTLDKFVTTPAERLQLYKAMNDALEATPNQGSKAFANVFGDNPQRLAREAQDATADLLVIANMAESVPPLNNYKQLPGMPRNSGRTPGSDALFRAGLRRELKMKDPSTFEEFLNTFPFSPQGGAWLMRLNPEKTVADMVEKGIDWSKLGDTVKHLSLRRNKN